MKKKAAADLPEQLKSYTHEKGTKWNTERQTKKMNTLVQENLWYFSEAESSFDAMDDDLKLNIDQINAIGDEMHEIATFKRGRTDSAATDASPAARPKKEKRVGVLTSAMSYSAGKQNSGTRNISFTGQGSRTRDHNTALAPWSKGRGTFSSR